MVDGDGSSQQSLHDTLYSPSQLDTLVTTCFAVSRTRFFHFDSRRGHVVVMWCGVLETNSPTVDRTVEGRSGSVLKGSAVHSEVC